LLKLFFKKGKRTTPSTPLSLYISLLLLESQQTRKEAMLSRMNTKGKKKKKETDLE